MEATRNYRRKGTPEMPMSSYWLRAGVDISQYSHYHPEIEINMVFSGTVTMQIGSVNRVFSKGDICIIPANTVHGRQALSDDATMRSIMFDVAAISLIPEHFFQQEFVTPLKEERLVLPTVLQPDHPAYEAVSNQIRQIGKYRIYEQNYKLGRFSALMNICFALMPHCQVISGEKPVPDPGNETVKLCMRYIHNHYFEKLTLDTLGEKCHLHPNYLCAVFKTYTGQTVFAYLNRYRIEVATELLRKERLPISKVAELTGFHSESLFYQKFKEHTGMTPKAYGKSAKKEKTKA